MLASGRAQLFNLNVVVAGRRLDHIDGGGGGEVRAVITTLAPLDASAAVSAEPPDAPVISTDRLEGRAVDHLVGGRVGPKCLRSMSIMIVVMRSPPCGISGPKAAASLDRSEFRVA